MLDTLQGDNPFVGDSSEENYKSNFAKFIGELQECKEGKRPFTLIFRDPLANCFIQNPHHPNPDPIVTVEEYERTLEENEDLGLNDIKVD
jgi:zinc finger protein